MMSSPLLVLQMSLDFKLFVLQMLLHYAPAPLRDITVTLQITIAGVDRTVERSADFPGNG